MKRPVIGINCRLVPDGKDVDYRLDPRYVRAVEQAGGIPILLPFARRPLDAGALLGRIDGLLLTGGADPHPRRWGEPLHPEVNLLPTEKEESDFLLARLALRSPLPILGVCYGAQLLNVASGGSLHQHLPDLAGTIEHREGTRHLVEIQESSRLNEILGRRGRVNSYHHQAIRRLGRGLRVTSRAPDEVIEGIEGESSRWLVGVQWHPERMPDKRHQRRLFSAFVAACR